MIKLKVPLNYKGIIYEKGAKIALDTEFEEKLIENGNADKYPKDKPIKDEENEVKEENNDSEEPSSV